MTIALSRCRRCEPAAALGIVVAAALFVADLEAFGFAAGGLSACVSLLLLGLALAGVAGGLFGHRPEMVRPAAILLLAVLMASMAAIVVSQVQVRTSQARGDALCRALEGYRQRHGAYPDALSELVPELLPSVPSSGMGLLHRLPFHYRKCGEDGYRIGFDALAFVVWERGPGGAWRCDD